MRRSTRTAIITSLAISSTVGGLFAALGPAGSDDAGMARYEDLKHQIAALSAENRRLSEAVSDVQLLVLKTARTGEQDASATDAAPAPMPLALTARAASEARRITDSASQAAATTEALNARFDEQRRLLFIQTPQCKKPDAEGLVICAVTMRNNDAQALLVSFSQSGSRVVLDAEAGFSSIRMRQLGQTRFSYTASTSIPAQGARVLEIAFGPAKTAPDTARSIALSVNKMTYEFADVALND